MSTEGIAQLKLALAEAVSKHNLLDSIHYEDTKTIEDLSHRLADAQTARDIYIDLYNRSQARLANLTDQLSDLLALAEQMKSTFNSIRVHAEIGLDHASQATASEVRRHRP